MSELFGWLVGKIRRNACDMRTRIFRSTNHSWMRGEMIVVLKFGTKLFNV
jgi:hypothetical protein